jgi:YD repeat-containing protein
MMMATYNNNNNIIGKKAPSLETFRRKWDSLSKRKGHISEHRMSIAEQKQLLRDSFSKTMIRPPTNNRRNHY